MIATAPWWPTFVVVALTLVLGATPVLAQCGSDPRELFGRPISKDADQWLTASNVSYNEKQGKLEKEWLAGATRFDYDRPRGKLVFSFAERRVAFDARVIGSVRHRDKSWEWGWSNPGVEPAARVPGEPLHEVGRRFDLRYLTCGTIPVAGETLPLFLTAIALKVVGGVGVHRAPSPEVDVYLLLSSPRVEPPR